MLLYPFLTAFSLLFVGLLLFFSGLSNLLSKLYISKGDAAKEEKVKQPEWKPLAQAGKYSIKKLYIDEILFGPAYNKLEAVPPVSCFQDQYFGDFSFSCFNGVLLQKWNLTQDKDLPDFTLVYLDGDTGNIKDLEVINSYSWNASQVNESLVVLKWFNGTASGEVKITKEKLFPVA